MEFELKERGIDQAVRMLQLLPPEVVSKRGGPVKLALKKGANVLRKAAAANLQRSLSNTSDEGVLYSTGLLLKSLIVSRGKPPTGSKGERYLVRVKRVSYPNRKGGGRTTTTQNGARLEYGTATQPAEPWLRPAYHQEKDRAARVVQTDLVQRIEKIAAKHLPR